MERGGLLDNCVTSMDLIHDGTYVLQVLGDLSYQYRIASLIAAA